MKKILITGSNGFVGQNLISSLSESFDVYGFDRNITNGLDKSHSFVGELGNFKMIDEIFEQVKPDVLIHLAAIVHKNNADTSEKNYDFINYECSKHLFNLASKYNTYVVFSSTIEVYGECDLKTINEETKCNPNSFYAISKYKAEECLRSLKLKYSILRFTPLYGKNFTLNVDKRVFLIKKKVAYYFKDGSYSFDFCSINNVCDFIKSLIEKDCENSIYVLADKEILTVEEIINMYKKYGDIKFTIKMPYHLCRFFIVIIGKVISMFKKKDVFLSKRNFDKLFASKQYVDTKGINSNFKWTLENTIYGEDYE